jgi:hypothetical protein
MALRIATLDGTNLPPQFSYRPYVQRKRNSVTPTANAVITQAASPDQIVDGDGTIPFNCEACTPLEFQFFHNKYDTAGLTLYDFVGYWGEEYEIYFSVLDQPTARGGIFTVSGQFQVICVTTPINATCPT